jgi:signal transduction histidine kinase
MASDQVDTVLAGIMRGQAPALYLLLDAEERVVECNQHTRALIGPKVDGARFTDLLANFEQHLSATALAAARAARNINVLTFIGLPQTYRAWFVPAEGRTVVFGSLDAGEQELLRRELLVLNQELSSRERVLQQSQAELQRLGRLKDQFLGMAAHDLRSPLTAIGFFAEFLEADVGARLGPEDAGYLQGIRSSVELMRKLVEAFLDAALIESGQLKLVLRPGSLAEVVREAAALLAPVARRRGVALALELDAAAPALPLDAPKIQQVVLNLVNNALQHSPTGAAVSVRVLPRGAEVVLEVADQGQGIAPEVAAGLFSAYVHGRREGTGADRSVGLGLAITRMIVLAHRGRVAATSEPGVGSVFTVHLPT